MTNTFLDPQTLAKQTLNEIEVSLEKKNLEEIDILGALQDHYTTLESNQRIYINYLSEFVEKLKTTQHADKESLAQLKKQVLKHVLKAEKNRE